MQLCNVDRSDVVRLADQYHYSGWLLGPRKQPGIKYAWGLESDGVLCGAVVFSVPASYTLCRGVCGPTYAKQVLELSRLVVTTPQKNAASFLVGGGLRQLGYLDNFVVVSYADCNEHVGHVGYVYQATNWLYTGHGSAEPKWVNPRDGSLVSCTRRHIDTKAAKLGLDWRDLKKVPQLGKHRYVTFVGDRRFRHRARFNLRYPVLTYPKGPTSRHVRPAKG